jgi:hypothetical protein
MKYAVVVLLNKISYDYVFAEIVFYCSNFTHATDYIYVEIASKNPWWLG